MCGRSSHFQECCMPAHGDCSRDGAECTARRHRRQRPSFERPSFEFAASAPTLHAGVLAAAAPSKEVAGCRVPGPLSDSPPLPPMTAKAALKVRTAVGRLCRTCASPGHNILGLQRPGPRREILQKMSPKPRPIVVQAAENTVEKRLMKIRSGILTHRDTLISLLTPTQDLVFARSDKGSRSRGEVSGA
jgi:hypothetical protein